MKEELKVFLTAIMFYTRIPVPHWVLYSQKYLDHSIRYFPLIGWIVGAVAGGIFIISQYFFPTSISLILSMIVTIMLTGAFHEDGFSDTCDGLGGGWTKKEVLDIMKDSRIGSYGTIGLVLILLFKFTLLMEISLALIPIAFIVSHTVSRLAVIFFRRMHQYVRENDDAKAKPMSQKMSKADFFMALMFGIVPLFVLPLKMAAIILFCVFVTQYLFSSYIVRRIGGFTGDCLGATQQLCEIMCYLVFVLWKSI
jgi:adenosylcobinamide-GDP ribazoletransferase